MVTGITLETPRLRNARLAELSSCAVGWAKENGKTGGNDSVPVNVPSNSRDRFPAFAFSAVGVSSASLQECDSVPMFVGKPIATSIGLDPLNSVPNAGGTSRPSTSRLHTVRLVAPPVIVLSGRPVQVYDLIVDDCHEFFANGVLVHNSWREGDHDDLLFAAAMAAWYGERLLTAWKAQAAESATPILYRTF
jgi:hypothetical protein